MAAPEQSQPDDLDQGQVQAGGQPPAQPVPQYARLDPQTQTLIGQMAGGMQDMNQRLQQLEAHRQAPAQAPAAPEAPAAGEEQGLEAELESLIQQQYAVTEKQYKNAMGAVEKVHEKTKKTLKEKIGKFARWMLPITGAYCGANIAFDQTIREALGNIPKALGAIGMIPGYIVQRVKESKVGIFDVPESRKYVLEGTGAVLKTEELEGGPFYKFFKAVFGKNFATSAAKALGTPLVSLFSRGVVAKGMTYASIPVWGTTVFPILGAGLGLWGVNKVYKHVSQRIGQERLVRRLQNQEVSDLRIKKQQYLDQGEDNKAEVVQAAIDRLPERVKAIRQLAKEEKKSKKQMRALQNAIALKV
jgi:hypothetical protein